MYISHFPKLVGVMLLCGLVLGSGQALPAEASATSWQIVSSASGMESQGSLYGVSCFAADECVGVGSYAGYPDTVIPSSTEALAERWNGSTWKIMSLPSSISAKASSLLSVSCPARQFCLAVGFTEGGLLAVQWNGVKWTIKCVPTPARATSASLDGVSCTSPRSCTAVGSYDLKTLALYWNGTTWKIQSTPNPSAPAGSSSYVSGLDGISCLSPAVCTAVGGYEYDTSSDETQSLSVIEQWNGGDWKIQPAPDPAGAGEAGLQGVSCSSKSWCVAVGSWTLEGLGESEVLLKGWNGHRWSTLSPPVPSGATDVQLTGVSCFSANQCTAAGAYSVETSGGFTSKPLAEQWDGRSWQAQTMSVPADGFPSNPTSISCPSDQMCATVGNYVDGVGATVTLGELWSGGRWTLEATPNRRVTQSSLLDGISCVTAMSCVGVGYTTTGLGINLPLIERWHDHKWTTQPAPAPEGAASTNLFGVSCPSASSCIAVGYLSHGAGLTESPLVEHWNGHLWAIQVAADPFANHIFTLHSVSCPSASMCIAVGYYYKPGSGSRLPLAERWDGSGWSLMDVPSSSSRPGGELSGISCSGPTACTAVGDRYNAQGFEAPLAERWNGKTWSVQASSSPSPGDLDAPLSSVSCPSSTWCTAVGSYGGESMIQAWNGESWSMEAPVTPLTTGGAELLGVSCLNAQKCTAVGDSSSESGDTQLTLAEQWNGQAWSLDSMPSIAGSPSSALPSISCLPATFCMAVGNHGDFSGQGLTLSEKTGHE